MSGTNEALNGLKAVVSREITPKHYPPSPRLRRGSCRFHLHFKNMEFSATANKPGFTLIEIMVALAIIALIAAVVAPRFGRGQPLRRRQAFTAEFNALLGLGWQQALTTNTIHRITFDFEKKQISVQQDQEAGQSKFETVKVPYVVSSMKLPDEYEIKQFFIEGHDEFQRSASRSLKSTYFYIVPDGLVQSVVINALDKSEEDEKGRPVRFGLVVHSFSGQCTYYDDFQKP